MEGVGSTAVAVAVASPRKSSMNFLLKINQVSNQFWRKERKTDQINKLQEKDKELLSWLFLLNRL